MISDSERKRLYPSLRCTFPTLRFPGAGRYGEPFLVDLNKVIASLPNQQDIMSPRLAELVLVPPAAVLENGVRLSTADLMIGLVSNE